MSLSQVFDNHSEKINLPINPGKNNRKWKVSVLVIFQTPYQYRPVLIKLYSLLDIVIRISDVSVSASCTNYKQQCPGCDTN